MQRARPAGHERGNGCSIREIESPDVDGVITCRRGYVSGGPLTGVGVAHGEGHIGPGARQRSSGFDPNPRGGAGDDGTLA